LGKERKTFLFSGKFGMGLTRMEVHVRETC